MSAKGAGLEGKLSLWARLILDRIAVPCDDISKSFGKVKADIEGGQSRHFINSLKGAQNRFSPQARISVEEVKQIALFVWLMAQCDNPPRRKSACRE